MKLARFLAGGRELYGIVEDAAVRVIAGDIYGAHSVTDETLPLGSVRLLAPVKPSKVVGIGLNYKSAAAARGVEHPSEPIMFLKPPSGIIGPDEPVVLPDMVKQPVFEAELAIVIGRQAKNVSEADALDYCLGYCLANDLTAKDHMIKGQPWAKGKSFDTFTPVGPYIVTGIDPDNTDIALLLNGVEKQASSTSDKIFSCRQLIAFVTSIMTLEAGDVILTGTPAGAGECTRGDRFTLTGSELGTMNNPVV